MNDDNLTAETIDELWCRIRILEEKVDNLMNYISKTQLSSVYGKVLEKEGGQS